MVCRSQLRAANNAEVVFAKHLADAVPSIGRQDPMYRLFYWAWSSRVVKANKCYRDSGVHLVLRL